MGRSRGIAALVCLALGASHAQAGDETQSIGSLGVEMRVWSPWPASVCRGWGPVRVELRNSSEKTRVVYLDGDANDWMFNRTTRSSVELGAGERTEMELLLPLGGQWQNAWGLTARCDGETSFFGSCLGSNSMDPTVRQVLLVSERAPAAGETEAWAAELSEREVTAGGTTTIPSVTLIPGASIGYTGPSAPITSDIDLAHGRFAGLARHWGAYTSLDLVVLDVSGGAPGAAEFAPLVAWVRTGGDLLVIGERAEAEARAQPELAAWMEARFRTEHDLGSEYRCGLGRLCVGSAGGVVTDYEPWTTALLAAEGSTTLDTNAWRGMGAEPIIPGLDLLPYRTFALLLLVFALVIGPVNLVFIAKKKKAVLLLVTIPAIAAVATLLLLGYGIFFQGLDVKTSSISLTLLDERAHRSSALDYRRLFAGLAPAEGLEPGPGTIVFAAADGTFQRQSFEVEYGSGTLLKGDYLPTRVPVKQVLATERAERARLVVKLDGERLRVDNNLGARIERLVLRDPDGRLFTLGAALAAGDSAALERDAFGEDARGLAKELHELTLPITSAEPASGDSYLPPGCYLAQIGASPFRDACGIEENERAGRHVVYGVLPIEAEAWR